MKLSVSPIILVIAVSALGGCATAVNPGTQASQVSTQIKVSEKTTCAPKRHFGVRKCTGPNLLKRIPRDPQHEWVI